MFYSLHYRGKASCQPADMEIMGTPYEYAGLICAPGSDRYNQQPIASANVLRVARMLAEKGLALLPETESVSPWNGEKLDGEVTVYFKKDRYPGIQDFLSTVCFLFQGEMSIISGVPISDEVACAMHGQIAKIDLGL